MSRNASGTYSLPAGNPVVTGTTITSSWANTTMADLATEMTDSLSRSGKGGMTGVFSVVDGSLAAPGLAFASELGSGMYRASAGVVRLVRLGVLRLALIEDGVAISSDAVAGAATNDFLVNTVNTRTAGSLLAVTNNAAARFAIGFDGKVSLGNLAEVKATGSNQPMLLRGNRDAADVGSDHSLDSTATRTAGDLLRVLNNNSTRFVVGFDGKVSLANLAEVKATASNTTFILRGNRDAGDSGSDVDINSPATRTAGDLLRVLNNGSTRLLVGFDGKVSLPNTAEVKATAANSTLTLRGNRNAGDAGVDVVVDGGADRTAGSLFEVRDNGTERFRIGFDGEIYKNGSTLTGGAWTLTKVSNDLTGGALADVTGLTFSADANSTYTIRAALFMRSTDDATTAGISVRVKAASAPTKTRMRMNVVQEDSAGSIQGDKEFDYDTDVTPGNFNPVEGSDSAVIWIYITLDTGASSGTFQLQFTKTGGGAQNPQILKGSYLEYFKL